MNGKWVAVAIVGVAVAGIIVHFPSARTGAFQFPKPGKAAEQAPRKVSAVEQYVKLLNEEVDLAKTPTLTLSELIERLSEGNKGEKPRLPIVLDIGDLLHEFADFTPDAIRAHRITLPEHLRKAPRAAILRQALASLPSDNATFVVRSSGVRITTLRMASLPMLLREKALGVYTGEAVREVMKEQCDRVGVSLMIDPRCGEKLHTPVTVTFANDTSLRSALTALAEMADLKCVIRKDSVFLTTPEHAQRADKARLDTLKERVKILQGAGFMPSADGQNLGGFNFGINPGGFPGVLGQPGGFNCGGPAFGGFGFTGAPQQQIDPWRWRGDPRGGPPPGGPAIPGLPGGMN